MKKLFIYLFAMTISSVSFAQNFEGKITYNTGYISRIPGVTSEQLASMMGSQQEYFIKDGDYKNVGNGTMLQWQTYVNSDNKLYSKMANAETLLFNDAAENTDEIISSEINKNVTDILGYKCDELILTCKSGIQKFYFNSKLGVDAKLFINHKYGNWYDFIMKSNALPLKTIIENPQFTLESTATAVTPMKLEKSVFELPANSKTEKSPY